ncbi:MAG TPA: hypothetical protein PKD55_20570, partial [Bellilinea sp.]|nr:hypothetical protein [Bellilinea sp.]
LADPEVLIAIIDELQNRHAAPVKQSRIDMIDQAIKQRLNPDESQPVQDTSEPIDEDEDDIVYEVEAGGVQQFLSALFALREEDGDTLIFRTHWLELLKRILLPAMIMIGAGVVVGLSAAEILPIPVDQTASAMAILASIAFLWAIYQWMDWRNDKYIITEEMLVDVYKKPFGTEDRRSAPLRNVLSIDYKRKGLSGILFNYGTVIIHVGDTDLTFNSVLDPAGVQQEIFDRLVESKERTKSEEEKARRDEMADWIERYHAATTPGFKPKASDTQQVRVPRLDDTQPLR